MQQGVKGTYLQQIWPFGGVARRIASSLCGVRCQISRPSGYALTFFMPDPELTIYRDLDELAAGAAERISRTAAESVAARAAFRFA